MAKKKCGYCNSGRKVVYKTAFTILDSHTTYLVYFEHNRHLQSHITGETVSVSPSHQIRVYEKDLREWISRGVFGIVFLENESEFLINNPDIRKTQYAR